jgi:uncharacterized repeat protein (TIGR03803 family)
VLLDRWFAQTLTTLYLFGGGDNPDGALIQATDGKLYRVTAGGPGKEDGVIYSITTSGSFTVLHGGGGEYSGEPVQGTDGNFYGTTEQGGSNSSGTLYKITSNGTLTTLYIAGFMTYCQIAP